MSSEAAHSLERPRELAIGEVATRAGMRASRIRYYEACGLLPEPQRVSGKRRYSPEVLRRLEIIDAAQRIGFTLGEIRDLIGSGDDRPQERIRQLALRKLPEIEQLIARASAVRSLLQECTTCDCESLDVCTMFVAPPLAVSDWPGGLANPLGIRQVIAAEPPRIRAPSRDDEV
jgi:DNA-binding transcriptional MerR regulator